VDLSDVSLNQSKDHFGFAVGQVTGLKYLGVVQTLEIKQLDGVVKEIIAEVVDAKPKSFVHWISKEDAVDCQVNLYDVLFES